MNVALTTLPLETPVVVQAVGGERAFRRRLMELGLVPGTAIRMTKVAPMGDPIELLVRGCRLSIRRQEADLLMVSATGAVRT
jgi:ferrous iron transport protein A